MDREKFKALSTGEKVKFLWKNYFWHGVTAVIMTTLCILWGVGLIRDHNTLLKVEMINADGSNADQAAFRSFLESSGYEYDRDSVVVNTNIQLNSKEHEGHNGDGSILQMTIMGKRTDLFFWDGKDLEPQLAFGVLRDLREVIPPELLHRFEDRLIYTVDLDTGWNYPCGIYLENNPWISENSYYETCAAGIPHSIRGANLADEFLCYLLRLEQGPETQLCAPEQP